ncbi:hypothetical protein PALB_24900 [Pseudoalteromonas luteoviolacea B = ATCC 29581]|nr:hypothetical protein PALB_24900 [Pseudoalteromonas luteoviolacea B = ATCC 29581]
MPLPPTPPMLKNQQMNKHDSEMVELNVSGAGSALEIDLDVDIPKVDMAIETPLLSMPKPTWQDVEVDWQAVHLSALDEQPKLLTPLTVSFPQSLIRQGIKQVDVKLDVLINENGRVTLISILANPFSELNQTLHLLVEQSQFTAPMQDSQPVRARFVWPLQLTQG